MSTMVLMPWRVLAGTLPRRVLEKGALMGHTQDQFWRALAIGVITLLREVCIFLLSSLAGLAAQAFQPNPVRMLAR